MKSAIDTPTIPLPEAQARIERYRAQMSAYVPQENMPRAILIPIDDLLAIVKQYETVDGEGNITNTLRGVRAYFAVKATDQALPDDITALIVPVDLQGNDIIVNPGKASGTDDTEIYDFTKPCPTECDTTSPLYDVP